MKTRTRGKRIALLVGTIGIVLVGLISVFYRSEIRAWYLAWHWRQIAVVVLDNCDPDYKGAGPHGDGVRFLREDGRQKFVVSRLNNCESIGCSHAVALDADRFRIYVGENVRHRVTAFEPTGSVVYTADDLDVSAVAVDSGTGDLWCCSGNRIGAGDVVVLDLNGKRVATFPVSGFDLAYNPFDQAFWVVGESITKTDREGTVLYQGPSGGWTCIAVVPVSIDGSVWIAERGHPGKPGSVDRILHLDREGKTLRDIPLLSSPSSLARDADGRTIWVADRGRSLLRISTGGALGEVTLDSLPVPALAVTVGQRDGDIWVVTQEEVLKVDREGQEKTRCPFPRASTQAWLAAP